MATQLKKKGRGRPTKNKQDELKKGPFDDCICWVCDEDYPLWKCHKCSRPYHLRCTYQMVNFPEPIVVRPPTAKEDDPGNLMECPECLISKTTSMISMNFVTPEDVKNILIKVLTILKDMHMRGILLDIIAEEGPEYEKTVGKVMDHKIMMAMINSGEITTLEGFYGTMKWIRHNTLIWEGNVPEIMVGLDEMLQSCREQMRLVSFCPSLYMQKTVNSMKQKDLKQAFKIPCNPPHILAWVKLPNYPWWPTKIVGMKQGKAVVVFFQDLTMAEVSLDDVRLYSTVDPAATATTRKGKRRSEKVKTTFAKRQEAIKDIGEHIESLRATYGRVVLATDAKTKLPPNLMYISPTTEVYKKMFPDYQLE